MKKELTNQEIAAGILEIKETTAEILGAVHAFSESVDKRFDQIESKMATKVQVKELISLLHKDKIITNYEKSKIEAAA